MEDDDGKLIATRLESQAAAWRWIDMHEGEVISPEQKRRDYGWLRFCVGQ